mgnify:FL=1
MGTLRIEKTSRWEVCLTFSGELSFSREILVGQFKSWFTLACVQHAICSTTDSAEAVLNRLPAELEYRDGLPEVPPRGPLPREAWDELLR